MGRICTKSGQRRQVMLSFSKISFVVFLCWLCADQGIEAFTVRAPHVTGVVARTRTGKNVPHKLLVENKAGKTLLPRFQNLLSTQRHAAPVGVAVFTLPSWKLMSLACILPTCIGYYKREYGVSYAYGSAVTLMALLVYRSLTASHSSIAAWHALGLVFYGIRLNLFLLYRELLVPSMREIRDRVEEKATSKEENRFMSRTPFILSCSFLYYCLAAPLLMTCHVRHNQVTSSHKIIQVILKGLVTTMWGGFLLAGVGDYTKTLVKKLKGADHLVTTGIFKYLRHPNYTGEMVAWTASATLALVSAAVVEDVFRKPILAVYSILSMIGAGGISFVLLAATKQLESKQKKKYGDQDDYKEWINSSWAGFQLRSFKDKEEHVDPHLELSDDIEELGSGI